MIDRDLSRMSQSDIYSIVCELLYTIKDDPKYSILSELVYLLDQKSFINFIKYFGGTTISIPTLEDFRKTIKIIQLYYYFNIENLSWREALEKSGFERLETRSAQKQLMQFTDILNNIKLGRNYD